MTSTEYTATRLADAAADQVHPAATCVAVAGDLRILEKLDADQLRSTRGHAVRCSPVRSHAACVQATSIHTGPLSAL